MAVDHHRSSPILGGPVVSNGQSKLVRLPRRFSVESKVAHLTRTASLHLFFHASVGDDQLSVIQDVVADELVEEFADLGAKLWGLLVELFQRIGEPMRDLYIFPTQFAHQLDVMVPRDAKCCSGFHHTHGQAQNFRNAWPAIDKVAEKNNFAPPWGLHGKTRRTVPVRFLFDRITKLGEKIDELFEATVDIPDDVEWTMLVLQVVPKRLPLNLSGVYFLRR